MVKRKAIFHCFMGMLMLMSFDFLYPTYYSVKEAEPENSLDILLYVICVFLLATSFKFFLKYIEDIGELK